MAHEIDHPILYVLFLLYVIIEGWEAFWLEQHDQTCLLLWFLVHAEIHMTLKLWDGHWLLLFAGGRVNKMLEIVEFISVMYGRFCGNLWIWCTRYDTYERKSVLALSTHICFQNICNGYLQLLHYVCKCFSKGTRHKCVTNALPVGEYCK